MVVEVRTADAFGATHWVCHKNLASTLALQDQFHLHSEMAMGPRNSNSLQVDIKVNHLGKLNQDVLIEQGVN